MCSVMHLTFQRFLHTLAKLFFSSPVPEKEKDGERQKGRKDEKERGREGGKRKEKGKEGKKRENKGGRDGVMEGRSGKRKKKRKLISDEDGLAYAPILLSLGRTYIP